VLEFAPTIAVQVFDPIGDSSHWKVRGIGENPDGTAVRTTGEAKLGQFTAGLELTVTLHCAWLFIPNNNNENIKNEKSKSFFISEILVERTNIIESTNIIK
jgi:hypothetical protein